jgi:hypothetical protein
LKGAGWRCGDDADTAHEAAAIRAEGEGFASRVCLRFGAGRRLIVGGLFSGSGVQQGSDAREVLPTIGLGEETGVADAVEAVGQNVQQEAADVASG